MRTIGLIQLLVSEDRGANAEVILRDPQGQPLRVSSVEYKHDLIRGPILFLKTEEIEAEIED